MRESSNHTDEARAAVQQAEEQIQSLDSSPFSNPAFKILKEKIGTYVIDLVNESVKVSKRHQADTVSLKHVERASDYLITNTSRRIYRHLGTIGGTLMGASLSNLLAMTLVSQYTGSGTIISSILGIIGAFMIALHIAKE